MYHLPDRTTVVRLAEAQQSMPMQFVVHGRMHGLPAQQLQGAVQITVLHAINQRSHLIVPQLWPPPVSLESNHSLK